MTQYVNSHLNLTHSSHVGHAHGPRFHRHGPGPHHVAHHHVVLEEVHQRDQRGAVTPGEQQREGEQSLARRENIMIDWNRITKLKVNTRENWLLFLVIDFRVKCVHQTCFMVNEYFLTTELWLGHTDFIETPINASGDGSIRGWWPIRVGSRAPNVGGHDTIYTRAVQTRKLPTTL